ncbi:MAG: WecB/TagA/CpsF family glycosyltransferase [Bacteroidales bacterium]|nr:WecB/TagA/CpsF family glycosyltransferase [Bacteroidales bacterium]
MAVKFFNYTLATELPLLTKPTWDTTRPCVIDCLNAHSFVLALSREPFRQALQHSTILLPDGISICRSLQQYRDIQIAKLAGDDLHTHLLHQLAALHGKAYYLGSSDSTLQLISQRIRKEYPTVHIRTYAPPFADTFTETENRQMIHDIEQFQPDVLWLGMTAPKQEEWVYQHVAELQSPKVIACVGAVFDFFAGTRQRAPKLWIDMHAEWLYRWLQEPRRMWQRNTHSMPTYLRYVRAHSSEM